ncbi:MAG: hypothetical protein IJZ26_01225 [Clostridia bacterium]|nr:hypothetical protein [Clostridia bacterium]
MIANILVAFAITTVSVGLALLVLAVFSIFTLLSAIFISRFYIKQEGLNE